MPCTGISQSVHVLRKNSLSACPERREAALSPSVEAILSIPKPAWVLLSSQKGLSRRCLQHTESPRAQHRLRSVAQVSPCGQGSHH